MRRKALKQKKNLESSPFWNPESTELESGIQYSESGIHRVESRIQDCHGFPYMGRIMKARRFQEPGCRFEISGARFERPMMKGTWQLLNVFIMVCSWDLIMVGFTEKFWTWKPENDVGNCFFLFSTLSSMGRPMCVVRARSCLPEWEEP